MAATPYLRTRIIQLLQCSWASKKSVQARVLAQTWASGFSGALSNVASEAGMPQQLNPPSCSAGKLTGGVGEKEPKGRYVSLLMICECAILS